MAFKHYSVLLEETIENLNIKPDGIYVDGTLGGGGHALEVVKQLSNKGRFFGIDQDDAAIEAAGERLSEHKDKITLIRSNYCNMKAALLEHGVSKVDGIVLDSPHTGALAGETQVQGELMGDNSVILASGIICERADDVISCFEKHGLKIVERAEENGWCALVVGK